MVCYLAWRVVTPPRHLSYLVDGTVLASVLFGKNSRYAAYEQRTTNGQTSGSEYIVRDAEVRNESYGSLVNGPPIVFRTQEYAKLLEFADTHDDEEA